jgi:putative DNA primase/helicase
VNRLNVPPELQAISNWVVWKYETRDGKETKVPYDARTGRRAKANDSATWTTFEIALSAADVLSGNDYDGVGFELGGTDLAGVDFDSAINTDGGVDPYALAILASLGNPYTELSPSGNGLHAFVECEALPKGARKLSKDHDGIEIYHGREAGRYLTVTGDKMGGEGVPKIADIALPYLLITQNKDQKFKALWTGKISGWGDDQSSADLALMNRLARLLNNDRARMEKYFSVSALGQREKWTEREDYRNRTLDAALKGKESQNPSKQESAAATSPAAPAEMMSHTAAQVKPKKLKWLWPDRVTSNKITLYSGNPDNGKSLAGIDLVARVTAGMNFPDCVNTLPPSEVLMLLGEDDEDDTAVPRLISAGADLTKVHFPEGIKRSGVNDGSEVRLDIDLPVLEAFLDTHPAIRLIVIDPISSYLGNVNMIAEQSVRSVLTPLRLMAMRRNVAVLFVMHLNKKSELDAISRVGGAMAFIGVARSAWLFIRDESSEEGEVKDSFTMCRMKSNLTASRGGGISYSIEAHQIPIEGEPEPTWAPYIVWGEKINKSADDSLGRTASKREAPGRPVGTDSNLQCAIAWLQDALQDGKPQSSKVLKKNASEEANISWPTLRRAQQALGIKPYQQKGGKVGNWVWEISPMNATAASSVRMEAQDGRAEERAAPTAGDSAEIAAVEQSFELK